MNINTDNSLEKAKAEANLRTAINCIELGEIYTQDIAYATDLPLTKIEELVQKHTLNLKMHNIQK